MNNNIVYLTTYKIDKINEIIYIDDPIIAEYKDREDIYKMIEHAENIGMEKTCIDIEFTNIIENYKLN